MRLIHLAIVFGVVVGIVTCLLTVTELGSVFSNFTLLGAVSNQTGMSNLHVPWVPCYTANAWNGTVITPVLLNTLMHFQDWATPIDDYLKLLNSTSPVYFAIPQVVHQVWLGASPGLPWPATFYDYLEQCKGWTYKTWTDAEVEGLQYLDKELYDKQLTVTARSEIVRLAILYEFGGYYVDSDCAWLSERCLDPLSSVASSTGFVVAPHPSGTDLAPQVIGSVKHHPTVQNYMKQQKKLYRHSMERQGAEALTAAVKEADNVVSKASKCPGVSSKLTLHSAGVNNGARHANYVTIVSSRYFYPLNWLATNTSDFQLDDLKKLYKSSVLFHFGYTDNNIPGPTW